MLLFGREWLAALVVAQRLHFQGYLGQNRQCVGVEIDAVEFREAFRCLDLALEPLCEHRSAALPRSEAEYDMGQTVLADAPAGNAPGAGADGVGCFRPECPLLLVPGLAVDSAHSRLRVADFARLPLVIVAAEKFVLVSDAIATGAVVVLLVGRSVAGILRRHGLKLLIFEPTQMLAPTEASTSATQRCLSSHEI